MNSIANNFEKIRNNIPSSVKVILAAKTRSKEEVLSAIEAGATDIGYNYVQEAMAMKAQLGQELSGKVKWHMIGHLQKSKINKALKTFDLIQTIDSYELAEAVDKRVPNFKNMPLSVLLQVNIGEEESKAGVDPNFITVAELARKMSQLKNIRLIGLMAIEPYTSDERQSREFFRKAKKLFNDVKELNLPNVEMKYLSMGMSGMYKPAIDEGSNMVRLGTIIFGPRKT